MHNPDSELPPPPESTSQDSRVPRPREKRRSRKRDTVWTIVTLVAFISGSLGGYFLRGQVDRGKHSTQADLASLAKQINPAEGYTVPASFGDLGPRLLEAGAIRQNAFSQVYEQAGKPLSAEQMEILRQGSETQVVFNQQNAYFLLNFFWAVGLANENPVLIEGPMMQRGQENVVGYASTGGWTLATRPVKELYASVPLIVLTPEQQVRLEEVVQAIYRPCCNNPTSFPDCNHGMAMLGLMELMASQRATADEMFQAAKYANAFWCPQQTLELATYFNLMQKASFNQADARTLVSQRFSSGSGFQAVHEWLSTNGQLPQAPGSGNNCGV